MQTPQTSIACQYNIDVLQYPLIF